MLYIKMIILVGYFHLIARISSSFNVKHIYYPLVVTIISWGGLPQIHVPFRISCKASLRRFVVLINWLPSIKVHILNLSSVFSLL